MCTSEHGAGSKTDLKAIAEILEDARLEGRLRSLKLSSDIVRALAQLATQAVAMGIDYKTLGIGWHHPSADELSARRAPVHPLTGLAPEAKGLQSSARGGTCICSGLQAGHAEYADRRISPRDRCGT